MKAKRLMARWLLGALLPMMSAADPVKDAAPVPTQEAVAQPRALAISQTPLRATALLGVSVTGREGQGVGTLADIIFDMKDGRIVFGVVKTMEDDRKIAVPVALLKANADGNALALECNEQRFRAASDFAKEDLRDPSWAAATAAYFGTENPVNKMAEGPVIHEAAGAELPAPGAPAEAVEMAPPVKVETVNTNYLLARSSDMIGAAVADSAGKPVGEIKDVAVDWKAQRMVFAVLDSTSATGLGNRYRCIAVAPKALSATASGGGFTVDAPKSELATAPSFDEAMWPSAVTGDFVEKVNHFYSH
jgi:sporulation protein YlmC with PRC-barrel domain